MYLDKEEEEVEVFETLLFVGFVKRSWSISTKTEKEINGSSKYFLMFYL